MKSTFNINVTKFTHKIGVNYFKFRYDLFYCGAAAPLGPMPPHFLGFTITRRHTTLGRTPLDRWSARRRGLYLTTHTIRKKKTSMPPMGFEPAILASKRQQTHGVDSAATGIGLHVRLRHVIHTLRHWTQSLVLSDATSYLKNSTPVLQEACVKRTVECRHPVEYGWTLRSTMGYARMNVNGSRRGCW